MTSRRRKRRANKMAQKHEATTKNPTQFLQLPREIRDEIYTQYCYSSPIPNGPLEGYVDIPSPAPLAVCKQMRDEMSPILYESLKHILIQDHVCLKLYNSKSPYGIRYAGWSIWFAGWDSSFGRNFNIWVRDGDEDGRYAAFWVDARNLSYLKEVTKSSTPYGSDNASHAFENFAHALEKLRSVMPPKMQIPPPVKARLNTVIVKVRRTLQEVKREAEAKAKTENETEVTTDQPCTDFIYTGPALQLPWTSD